MTIVPCPPKKQKRHIQHIFYRNRRTGCRPACNRGPAGSTPASECPKGRVSCDLLFSPKRYRQQSFLSVEYFRGWYLVPKGVNGNPPEIRSIPLPALRAANCPKRERATPCPKSAHSRPSDIERARAWGRPERPYQMASGLCPQDATKNALCIILLVKEGIPCWNI